MTVLEVMTRGDRLAVELDVRTHCDGLVEGRLGHRCVGGDAAAGVIEVAQVAGISRSAMDMRIHAEGGTARIAIVARASAERHRGIREVVMLDQIVDLIDIEHVAVTVQRLIDDIRHDQRVSGAQPVKVDNRRMGQGVEVEIDVDRDIHAGVDVIFDSVLDVVIEIVANAVIEMVVNGVGVAIAVVVAVAVVVAIIIRAVVVVSLSQSRKQLRLSGDIASPQVEGECP